MERHIEHTEHTEHIEHSSSRAEKSDAVLENVNDETAESVIWLADGVP
jgi:hypothetical protein